MTHLASRQNLDFGTPATRDGESMHSGFTKVESDLQYLFEMADTLARRVNLVADLATLDKPIDNELVATGGWRAEDDHGAKVYRYDSSSSAGCNGGTVLDGIGGSNSPADTAITYPGTGTGRFFAVNIKKMNAKQWGTYGDGVTDDSFRLQAWGDTAGANELDLGGLSYAVDTPGWTISTSNKTLSANRGGIVATALSTLNSVEPKLTVVRVTGVNVTLSGVDFDGGGFAHSLIAMEGDGFVVKDCKVHDAAIPGAAGLQVLGASDFTIERSEIYDNTASGIYLGTFGASFQVSRGWVRGCYVHGNSGSTSQAAIFFSGSDLHIVDNLFLSNIGVGISSVTLGSATVERVTVSGNEFNGNHQGIGLLQFSGPMREIYITDNQIIDSADIGIIASAITKLNVSGNTIISNFGTIGATPGNGVRMQNCTDSVASRNFIRAGDVGYGVLVVSVYTRISVSDNWITNGDVGVKLDINDGSTQSDELMVSGNFISTLQASSTGIELINSGVANAINAKITNNFLGATTDITATETGAGGDTGWELTGNTSNKATPTVAITNGELERNDGNSWNRSVFWGTSIPTTGLHTVGDRVWNENPATGISHWLCTTAGTPGIWDAFGDGIATEKIFETVAIAKAASLSDLQYFSTAGRTTLGDGGGTRYQYHLIGRTGVTTDEGFFITGSGADDYLEAVDKTVANIAQFGAVGDDDGTGQSGTDDTAAILAAINSGAKYIRSHWQGKKYRILASLPLWSTHDGLMLDFGNDWLMPDPELFADNDVVQVISGGTADQTPAAHVEFKIVIKNLNIDGNWDYAAFAAEVSTQFSAASTADTVAVVANTQLDIVAVEFVDAVYGTARFNGLSFIIVAGGTGKSEAYHKNHVVENLYIKNIAKSGMFIANPESMKVGTVRVEGCGVHPIVTDWVSLAGDTEIGQGSLVIAELLVDGGGTGFDFSTTVAASKTVYDAAKVPTLHVGSVVCKEIQGRTKVHGPWNIRIDLAVFKDPDMGNKYPAIDIAAESLRRVDIGTLEVEGYGEGYAGPPDTVSADPIVTSIDSFAMRNQNRIATTGTLNVVVAGVPPHLINIGTLTTENCQLIAKNCVSIDSFNCRMDIDEPGYWANETAQYPFDLRGASIIKGGVIHDFGFGALAPTYVFFLRDPECSVSDVHMSSSVSDGTLLAWAPSTSVADNEYRYFQTSPATVPELWQSDSARTTGGGTFDATEQDFWTEIGAGGGTGDGRSRRFAFIDNTFDGQVRVDHCNMEGCWDRDFVATNTDRHSVAASNNTNIRFAALPTAIPTAGDYKTPLRFWYPEPAAGGMLGARLVTGGTPGTWEEFGGGAYGGISAESNATVTTIASSSSDFTNKVQIVTFGIDNSTSLNVTPDHTSDHLTTDIDGNYQVGVSMSITGTAADTISFAVFKNNGAVQMGSRVTHTLTGNVDALSLHLPPMPFVATDTVEVWIQNETAGRNITMQDASFSVHRFD